jgi:hypothetical protein
MLNVTPNLGALGLEKVHALGKTLCSGVELGQVSGTLTIVSVVQCQWW